MPRKSVRDINFANLEANIPVAPTLVVSTPRFPRLRMVFTAFISKFRTPTGSYNHKRIVAFLLVVSLVISTVSYLIDPQYTQGATYTFDQTTWTAQTSNTASHPTGQAGWTDYASKSNITSGGDLSLSTSSSTIVQTNDGSTNTGFNLTGNSKSSTTVSGTGDSASVVLAAAAGGWTTSSNPSNGADQYTASAIDSTGIYLAGRDFSNADGSWRLEKRSKSDGSLISAFGTSGVIVENIDNKWETITSIAVDSSYLYVAGWYFIFDGGSDEECSWVGDSKWRLEKRDKTTGALVSGFGTSGVITVDPFANSYFGLDTLDQIRIDSTAIYLMGVEGGTSPGYCYSYDGIYRYEKRSIIDGSLISGFGTNGVVEYNPSGSTGEPVNGAAIDSNYIYIGWSAWNGSWDWYVEKRSLTNGALDTGFDSDGVLVINDEYAYRIYGLELLGSSLYLVGDSSSGLVDVLIQKRSSITGALDNTFGSSGSVIYDTDPQDVSPRGAAVGSDGLYVVGLFGSAGNNWHVQKRDLSSGALDTNFGTSGIVNMGFYDDTAGYPRNLLIDSDTSSFYWSGYTKDNYSYSSPDDEMRIEKRSLSTGFMSASYAPSGTFTSGAIDTTYGVVSWGALSWTHTGGQTLTVKARSADNSAMTSAPDWGSCTNITNTAALSTGGCVTNGHRYIQYQASLSTSNTAVTPSLNDLTVAYSTYNASGNLVSSKYNSGDGTNAMGQVIWEENETLPQSTSVTVSVRTASSAENLDLASWNDLTNAASNCDKAATTVTCLNTALPSGLRDGSGDQWFQYKVALTGGTNTPAVTVVRVKYVVNAPPEFDSSFGTNGVTVVQDFDDGNDTWGKVLINYKVRDTDTSTGSSTPGFITPSFEYNIGAGWIAITSQYLEAADVTNKSVEGVNYTQYSATWDAPSQLAQAYSATAQIRVTANDNEGANNTARATSDTFILDTTDPTAAVTLDASAGTLNLNLSDSSGIIYRLSNNSDFTADGLNAISGEWQDPSAATFTGSRAWNFTGAPNTETVYLEVRDIYGNATSAVTIAPAQPQSVNLMDIGNTETENYKEFLSWSLFESSAGATFNKYEVYRSKDGAGYVEVAEIANAATNYYLDADILLSSQYSYKIRAVDSNSDISRFSDVVTDTADGLALADAVPPVISAVSASAQSTWATITWTTDELSTSLVGYSSTEGAYSSTKTSGSYVTSHSVTLTGLTPQTTYYYRVTSQDVLENSSTNDNSSNGFSFTTLGGPIITDVSVINTTDNSATITWNTNTDSNSYVRYSTSSTLAGATESGSSSLVGGSAPYQHVVQVTGLTGGTTYYFSVKSTDSQDNFSIDTNGGSYYSFHTSLDYRGPEITNLSAPVVTPTSAVVFWQTSEPATSQVFYGQTAETYDNNTVLDSTLSVYHSVTLTELDTDIKYYIVVKSQDAAENLTTSSEINFTTTDNVRIVSVGGGGGGGSTVVQDATAPILSDIKVEKTDSFSTEITFKSNENAVGFVEYGIATDYGMTAGSAAFATDHLLKINGLKMGTEYHYRVKLIDRAGNAVVSEDGTFKTKYFTESLVNVDNAEQFQQEVEDAIESALPSLVPPFVEKPEVTEVTETSAIVKWRTNTKSYSVVNYAAQDEYKAGAENPYNFEISDTTNKVYDHEIKLLNLQPNTKYHVLAKSFRLPQVVGASKDMTFITKALKVQARISDVTNTSFKVDWASNDKTNSYVEYKNTATGQTSQRIDKNMVATHSMVIDNLIPATTYEVKVYGYNASGNLVEAGQSINITTSQDMASPEISALKIETALIPGKKDKTQTVVRWRTNELADSTVAYSEGTGEGELKNSISQAGVYVLDHAIVLSDLKPGGVYRIQVTSVDSAGNKTMFPVRTVVIPRESESILDVITKNFEDTFGFLKR